MASSLLTFDLEGLVGDRPPHEPDGAATGTQELVDASDTIEGAADLTSLLAFDERVVFDGFLGDNPNVTPAENDVDIFNVTLTAFQRIIVDVLGFELSGIDTVVRIFDAATGRELAFDDDTIDTDPVVDFVAPADGVYSIAVSGFANTEYDPTIEGSGTGGQSIGEYDLGIQDLGVIDRSYFVAIMTDVSPEYGAIGIDTTLEIANVSGDSTIDAVLIDLGASFADTTIDERAPFVLQPGEFRGLQLGDVTTSIDGEFLLIEFAEGSFAAGDRMTVAFGVNGELPGEGVEFAARRGDGVIGRSQFEGTAGFAIANLDIGPPLTSIPAAGIAA